MLSLKNFKAYDALSEETLAFSAKVCWKGRVVGEATNDGHGGSTNVRLNPSHRSDPEVMASARQIARQGVLAEFLPEDDKDPEGLWALEFAVDTLTQSALEEREKARIARWEAKNAKAWAAKGYPFTAFWSEGEKRNGKAWRTAEARSAAMAAAGGQNVALYTEKVA